MLLRLVVAVVDFLLHLLLFRTLLPWLSTGLLPYFPLRPRRRRSSAVESFFLRVAQGDFFPGLTLLREDFEMYRKAEPELGDVAQGLRPWVRPAKTLVGQEAMGVEAGV